MHFVCLQARARSPPGQAMLDSSRLFDLSLSAHVLDSPAHAAFAGLWALYLFPASVRACVRLERRQQQPQGDPNTLPSFSPPPPRRSYSTSS